MASSTHAGALQSRQQQQKSQASAGMLTRIAQTLGLADAHADPDILDILKTEHREVQALLDQMLAENSGANRTSLFRKFKAALLRHARAEEKIVYDRLVRLSDRDSKIAGHEGHAEHALADVLIARAMKIRDKMSPEWTATVKVLREMLNHHIAEEENMVFSEVRDHFKAETRREMGRAFEEAKKAVRATR